MRLKTSHPNNIAALVVSQHMIFSPSIDQLMNALRCLPGIGPKTAQRMAFFLLEDAHRKQGLELAQAMSHTLQHIKHCRRCRTFSEDELCPLCTDLRRNQHLLCVVETPADILAIEQTHTYRGLYFVLLGRLSPLDGIGPEELKLHELLDRVRSDTIEELILATNHTVEGTATAHYIHEMVSPLGMITSRIAHGVPSGGELEYIDSRTLANALTDRTRF